MKRSKRFPRAQRRGAALLVSLIFIVLFSTLAVGMAAMSGSGLQLADNHRRMNAARTCAESGHQIVRYWLGDVAISGTTPAGQTFSSLAADFQTAAAYASGVAVTCDSTGATVPQVTLNAAGETFTASIVPLPSATNPTALRVDVTGACDGLTKTVRTEYRLTERANSVFDFGVATKGPLSLAGNILLEGVNIAVESSVYIESENDLLALSIIGNSQIAGDVSVVNPLAMVHLQGGKAGIGGETGAAAIDNHVTFGVPPAEFPEPDCSFFEPYVVNVIDASTDLSAAATYDNVRIVAGTHPNFTGNVTLRGVVFIEAPNIVTFSGNAVVIGMIVGDGDVEDDSGVNRITFSGTVDSRPLSQLPAEEQFADLRQYTGTFVLAPGFSLSFGGNFNTLNGAIAANGIQFYGNAGGTIAGSAINYSDVQMTLTGNSDLYFNRSGITHAPPGFVPQIVLAYDPAAYLELPY